MFFNKETISFNILDVIKINQQNVNMFNTGRNFDAISFRFHADTFLKTETQEYCVGDNTICYFPAMLDYTRISKLDEMIVVHFDATNYFCESIELFTPQNPQTFEELFEKIYAVWSKKQVGYKHKCSAILCEIFAECYVQNFTNNAYDPKIKSSVIYMNEHFKDSNISIKEIADKSFISEVYFRKLFRREFGISPQKHLINLRIGHAIGLMSTGYYLLKEIAYMSGYTDYKYFSTEFKRIKGVSPSEYLYNCSDFKKQG